MTGFFFLGWGVLRTPFGQSLLRALGLSADPRLTSYVPETRDDVMPTLGYALLALCVLIGAIAAVLAENLIRAAVALGIGSAALAMLLFLLNAPYAGGFELSVGSGLISILFIIAISLTEFTGEHGRGS